MCPGILYITTTDYITLYSVIPAVTATATSTSALYYYYCNHY